MKKLWQWIKHPPVWALIIFYIITAAFIAAAITFIVLGVEKHAVAAYVFFVLAAVTLGYSVYTLVLVIPSFRQKTVDFMKSHRFIARLYGQYGFRTVIFALVSLVISIANAAVNGSIGIIYLSSWYLSLGVYYFLLALMRGGVLVYHTRKGKFDEPRLKLRSNITYLCCGELLILLPLALSFVIIEMAVSDRAFVSAGLMIYVAAAYTFYKIITAIVNVFRARKDDEITVQAIRNVNLADALVSVLALQTAMFHEFSPGQSLGYANAIMGAIVCALTAALGVFMAVKGARNIKKLKSESAEGENIL